MDRKERQERAAKKIHEFRLMAFENGAQLCYGNVRSFMLLVRKTASKELAKDVIKKVFLESMKWFNEQIVDKPQEQIMIMRARTGYVEFMLEHMVELAKPVKS